MEAPALDTSAHDAAAQDQPGPGLVAWIGLGILVMLAFVSFLDRQIIALLVSPIERDLRISDTEIGLLGGFWFSLAPLPFVIVMGYAADYFSRRWVIFWSVSFWALAAMAGGLAHSYGVLAAARAGVGFGEAAVTPAMASLLSEIFPRRRLATVFSIYGSGSILGQACAYVVGGAVISRAGAGMTLPVLGHLAAWQIAFIVTGAPAALLAWLIFLVPDPVKGRTARLARRAAQAGWGEVFAFIGRNWLFLFCYALGQALLIMVTMGFSSWQPTVLVRSYGLKALDVGWALGIFTVAFGFTGQLANGLIVDRIFARRKDAHFLYYVIGTAIMTVSGCLAPFAPNAVAYLAILGPLKFLTNFGGVFVAALQVATPLRLRGRLTALSSIVTGAVGFTLGPMIVPFITQQVFHDPSKVIWSVTLVAAIFFPIAGLLFAIGLRPMREAVLRLKD
jgi:MFS family permease